MKVYLNEKGSINRVPADETKLFQNSGNNQEIILYDFPEGEEVSITFTRQDRVKYVLYAANYSYVAKTASDPGNSDSVS